MTIHPHDTDRILGVLGDAIAKLRDLTFQDVLDDLTAEVANDLALLHGAVGAERDRADSDLKAALLYRDQCKPKDIDVKRSEAGRRRFLRLVHHEEIQAEVDRGEHREDDWDA